MDAALRVRQLINGYQVSQAIHVAVVLGLPDLIGDGSRSAEDLAGATGCHARSLYRLLRALATVGVFRELPQERFASTELSDALRTDTEVSLAGWAAFVGRPDLWSPWSALLHSVRTGENAFRSVHGQDVWEHRRARAEESTAFDAAMTSLTSLVVAPVLDAYDFGQFPEIADIGGGRGRFIASILARWPAVRGVLFDQPHVVADAPALLARESAAQRCRVVPGNFFEAVPEGADAYLLKDIVHDWPDRQTVEILQVCRRCMPDTARLLIVERVIGRPNEGRDAAFTDLNMLVMPGGQERTEAEYHALLEASGFRLAGVVPSLSGYCVVEAEPA